ncbi:MAG: hypothetical protein KatS3mg019_0445 [Fimbriimonadales bacterium]|nr:MAG: hypothetical protein KatS3mg019_0445 [Fimbriimonadales bacterium]
MGILRERFGLILLIGLVAGLLLYALRLASEARDPRFIALPLSYSQHRFGAKGLARLLERNGYTVRSLKRTFRHIPNDAAMLIIFPPPIRIDMLSGGSVYTEQDAQRLERWLRAGGQLILLSGDGRLPETLLGESPAARLPPFQFSSERNIDAQPTLPLPWLEGVQQVRLADTRLTLSPREARWVPLLHSSGAIKGALWYYGKGAVFECADWRWLTNERIQQADNGAFILATVRKMLPNGGVIYLDDAGQGDIEFEREARGFWGVAPAGVRVAFAHLMLLTGIIMYSVGKRFGLPRPTLPHAPALGEYVDALASVYERAHAAQPALETVLDDIRRRLCQQIGLPAGVTLLQLIQSLPADSPLRDTLTEAYQALQSPNLTPQHAIRLLQRLEPLVR